MSDARLADIAETHAVPGMAAALCDASGVRWLGCHGFADLEDMRAVTPDTAFYFASITKGLTGVLLADLARHGVLDLDRPIHDVLPWLRLADPVATQQLSLRDCLCHRGGLASGNASWYRRSDDVWRSLAHLPVRHAFRQGFAYQNVYFTIVEQVLRTVTGRWWSAHIRDRVLSQWSPGASIGLSGFSSRSHATPYGPSGFSTPMAMSPCDLAVIGAGADVNGSIRDLAAIASALASGGGDAALRAALSDVVVGCQALPSHIAEYPECGAVQLGLGIYIMPYRDETAWFLSGGIDGFTSYMAVLPQRGVAACALSNRDATNATEAMVWTLLDSACGISDSPWPARLLASKQTHRIAAAARRAATLATTVSSPHAEQLLGHWLHPAFGGLEISEHMGEVVLMWRGLSARVLALADGGWHVEPLAWWWSPGWRLDVRDGTLLVPLADKVEPSVFVRA